MSVFALQYARALADVVFAEKLDTEHVDQQLRDFLATYTESKELREVFSNPSIELSEKLKVLDAISTRLSLAPAVRNFFAVLLQNDRMYAVSPIVVEYRREVNSRLRITEAEITSVRELNGEEKSKVEARAADLAGTKIHPVYKQDPALLGGVVLRIGDTVYDGSVRGQLEELHQKLLAQ